MLGVENNEFEAVYKRYPYLVDAQVADTGSVGARLLQPDG
jgi:hypothetical protein